MNKEVEKLVVAKEIFDYNYDDFIRIVSSAQTEINDVSTLPIDNYANSIINDKDKDLLKYIYKNIKYYFDVNQMYTSKISEGMAIFVSKAIILNSGNIANLRQYFLRGNHNIERELSNPFEEMSRLLINSIINDSGIGFGNGSTTADATLKKIKIEDKAVFEGLHLAVTENGVFDRMSMYDSVDNYINMCADLEMSDIDSEHVFSATTKDSRGIILTQIDRIIDIYHTKLDFEQLLTGYPTQSISNKMRSQFENKVLYTKRNMGVYEKTKQLVLKSQH